MSERERDGGIVRRLRCMYICIYTKRGEVAGAALRARGAWCGFGERICSGAGEGLVAAVGDDLV